MPSKLLIAATFFSLASACATLQKDGTVCPEYQNLRCATKAECSMDAARGCRVCTCAPPVNHMESPQETLPPDRRLPR